MASLAPVEPVSCFMATSRLAKMHHAWDADRYHDRSGTLGPWPKSPV